KDQEIADLTSWVKIGAPWPESSALQQPPPTGAKYVITPEQRAFWAFQPVRKSPDAALKKSSIDHFIRSELEKRGLRPAKPAGKRDLIRRATFDLIGLPPTPEEVDAFVKDTSSDAFARLVDRLLTSPHYGERWVRHWLDLARYAESDGFEHDAARPHAWRYRDYVIQSFNADKPYDRFLREQIAGDELWPDSPEAVTATA